jgi:uncharacterized sporulation protein YeaH/YhbH (DUF444 family)
MGYIDKTTFPDAERDINHKKFLERASKGIKDAVSDSIKKGDIKGSIKDLVEGGTVDVDVDVDNLDLPQPTYSDKDGYEMVGTGNDVFNTGDDYDFQSESGGAGDPEASDADGEECGGRAKVRLDINDFKDLFFKDMELPNMHKNDKEYITSSELRRAGYQRRGAMTNLNIKKSYENLMGRMAAMDDDDLWFEDVDLKFNHREHKVIPNSSATIICAMDISGSMGEEEIDMARLFYFLFNLFLKTKYDKITIKYVTFHSTAAVVSEKKFFNPNETGGTQFISAIELIGKMLNRSHSMDDNLYLCVASDGDDFLSSRTAQALIDIVPWFNGSYYVEIDTRGMAVSSYVSLVKKSFMKAMTACPGSTIDWCTITKKDEVFDVLNYFFSTKQGDI